MKTVEVTLQDAKNRLVAVEAMDWVYRRSGGSYPFNEDEITADLIDELAPGIVKAEKDGATTVPVQFDEDEYDSNNLIVNAEAAIQAPERGGASFAVSGPKAFNGEQYAKRYQIFNENQAERINNGTVANVCWRQGI